MTAIVDLTRQCTLGNIHPSLHNLSIEFSLAEIVILIPFIVLYSRALLRYKIRYKTYGIVVWKLY